MWNQHGVWTAAALVLAALCDGGPVVAQCEETAKLTASDGATWDLFGRSVSVSGDVAVIGAVYDDDNGTDSGSAYLLRYDGAIWVEEAKLTASDGAAGDFFGFPVSISGDVAVIGASGDDDDDNGYDSGSAYVFRYDGATWRQEEKLTASDGEQYDRFGTSAAVSGDVAIVGAYGNRNRGMNDAGAVYVFRRDGESWEEAQKLTASDGESYDWFGYSAAIDGDVVIVGAFNRNIGAGAAYIFRWSGAAWEQEQGLTGGGLSFGYSVAISGNSVIVGTPGDIATVHGAAYVYTWNGAAWVYQQRLTASDAPPNDGFGTDVAIQGDLALAGAPVQFGYDIGGAYLFRWNGAAWVEQPALAASDGSIGNFFGKAVSLSEDRALIGADHDDDNDTQSGSAYVFDLNCPAACPADLDGDGAVGFGDFLAVLAAWGPCEGCPEDLDDDGVVGMREILIMLSAWGPCE